MTPKKVLFCTDFSENSEPAGQLAAAYANAFGAQLLIVHVINSNRLPNPVDWVAEEHNPEWADEALERLLKLTKDSANAQLESLAKECGNQVGDVKTYCRIGLPPNEIVSLAAEESVDLIVAGTHGRTGVKHLVMGSISRGVLKMASQPVLIVKA